MRRLNLIGTGGRVFVYLIIMSATGLFASHALGLFARSPGLIDKFDVDYVVLDFSKGKYRVSPELASGSDGTESMESMLKRLEPYALIAGTYYDENNKPLGDIVCDGKVMRRGCQRQAIGFTSSGKIKFFERKGRSRIDWRGCYAGIACGPRLLRAGKRDIDVKRDGFRSAAATNKAWRCAIGATRDNKLVLCAVPSSITLSTLADIMLELRAHDAINLDGGSMCALYAKGKTLIEPVKPLNNAIAVYKVK